MSRYFAGFALATTKNCLRAARKGRRLRFSLFLQDCLNQQVAVLPFASLRWKWTEKACFRRKNRLFFRREERASSSNPACCVGKLRVPCWGTWCASLPDYVLCDTGCRKNVVRIFLAEPFPRKVSCISWTAVVVSVRTVTKKGGLSSRTILQQNHYLHYHFRQFSFALKIMVTITVTWIKLLQIYTFIRKLATFS